MNEHRLRHTKGRKTASLADMLQPDRLEAVISFAGDWPEAAVVAPAAMEAERDGSDDGAGDCDCDIAGNMDAAEPAPSMPAAAPSTPTPSAQGSLALRERICAYMALQGIAATPDNLLVTPTAGASIALIAGTLLQPGDAVFVENPTHPGSVNALRKAGLRVVAIASDEEGPIVSDLELLFGQHRPKLLYSMPTFGVPDSKRWSEERRLALLGFARRSGMLIVEDDPYGALGFSASQAGSSGPAALFERGRLGEGESSVIYTGTFAAMFGPQASIGWIACGSDEILARLTQANSARDIGSAAAENHNERKLEQQLRHCDLARHSQAVATSIAERMRRVQALLRRQGLHGVTWNEPQGGMFLWIELPPGLDAEALLRSAAVKRVTFDPGAPFYAEQPQRNRLRLNVASAPEGRLEAGIARFAEAVNEFLGRASL